jgi:hypothetical protein
MHTTQRSGGVRVPKDRHSQRSRAVALAALAALCATFAGSPSMAADNATAAPATDASTTVAQAPTGNNPFRDVPPNHWAYQAVQTLSSEGLIKGYPNGTFRGNRPITRYEMAEVINRAVNTVEQKIAAGNYVSRSDLDTLRRLVDEFGNELRSVQGQVATLNRRVDSMQRELAADTQQLRQAKVGITFWQRPGTFNQSVDAVTGPTAALGAAANSSLPNGALTGNFGSGNGSTAQNNLNQGTTSRGVDWQDFRLAVSGNLDPRINYAARIESIMRPVVPTSGVSNTTPFFCTNAACNASGDYPGSMPLRLNYAWAGWTSPGGLFVHAGRFVMDEGRYNSVGFMGAGAQANGIQIGYNSGGLALWAAPVWINSAATNLSVLGNAQCPAGFNTAGNSCAGPGNTVGFVAKGDYFFAPTQTDVGATYDGYNSIINTEWNPVAGLCTPTPGSTAAATTTVNAFTAACPGGTALVRVTSPLPGQVAGAPITGAYQNVLAPIKGGSVFIAQLLGNHKRPQFKIIGEGEARFGDDPLTHQKWVGNKSFFGEFSFASKGNLTGGPLIPGTGIRNSNVFSFLYYNIQQNGLTVDGGPYGTAPWWSFYYGNQTNWQTGTVLLEHWFNDNFRAGIGYTHFGTQNGVTIPAGSTSCPGCYIRSANANTLFLDTYLIF